MGEPLVKRHESGIEFRLCDWEAVFPSDSGRSPSITFTYLPPAAILGIAKRREKEGGSRLGGPSHYSFLWQQHTLGQLAIEWCSPYAASFPVYIEEEFANGYRNLQTSIKKQDWWDKKHTIPLNWKPLTASKHLSDKVFASRLSRFTKDFFLKRMRDYFHVDLDRAGKSLTKNERKRWRSFVRYACFKFKGWDALEKHLF